MAWVRGFWFMNVISFLPLAVSYTRLNGGNYGIAKRFQWIMMNWSYFMGFLMSIVNFILYGITLANDYHLGLKIGAGIGCAVEATGLFIFFFYRADAYRYANHLDSLVDY